MLLTGAFIFVMMVLYVDGKSKLPKDQFTCPSGLAAKCVGSSGTLEFLISIVSPFPLGNNQINPRTGINHPLPNTHHAQKLQSTHSNNLLTIKYSGPIDPTEVKGKKGVYKCDLAVSGMACCSGGTCMNPQS
ncbi:uncharacterized protein PGTG_16149 [Puccinia graminis f. sp. tritici CRL 75-36-700-3]|uniref:Uncharacterized protein n=1 Tax=Puccinia graminis f. sp. tritici (strain CRL 75-36-700-3 / race SCCL) TaxID=418459 RepID=E3L1G4_PUCGT|nr:uncharacterized protein PGTG_16149 [Puccinia graminis f. sp. tritici CRL 75-36-700-3]EFP90389.1 hypothetical protein PGTG_16149 [Puccinia graminis f. sp. tritici CRL 75-36-700-3]